MQNVDAAGERPRATVDNRPQAPAVANTPNRALHIIQVNDLFSEFALEEMNVNLALG